MKFPTTFSWNATVLYVRIPYDVKNMLLGKVGGDRSKLKKALVSVDVME